MNHDDLEPHVRHALAAPGPIDAARRDEHIAEALGHFSSSHARPRLNAFALGAAAALFVVAFVVGRTTASQTPSPVVTAPTTTVAKTGLAQCGEQFDNDAELIHTYEVNDIEFAIVRANGQTFILETQSCTYITQFASAD